MRVRGLAGRYTDTSVHHTLRRDVERPSVRGRRIARTSSSICRASAPIRMCLSRRGHRSANSAPPTAPARCSPAYGGARSRAPPSPCVVRPRLGYRRRPRALLRQRGDSPPVLFVVALLVSYVVEGAVAGDLTGSDRSLAADLLSVVAVVVLTAIPAGAAWHWGRSAELSGDGRGVVPRRIAGALAVLAVVFVLVQLVMNIVQNRY